MLDYRCVGLERYWIKENVGLQMCWIREILD